jgi:hypothetical protein
MKTYTIHNIRGTKVAMVKAGSQLEARIQYAASVGMGEAYSSNFTAVLAD